MSFASCFSSPPLPLFVFKCVFRKSVAKLLTPTYSVSGAIIHGRWCVARRAARGGRESLGRTPTTQTKVTWTSIDDSDFCLPVSRVSFPTMWGHAVRAGMPVAGGAAPGLLASRDRYFCNVNVRILQANAASGRHVHGKNPMPTLGCRVCWFFLLLCVARGTSEAVFLRVSNDMQLPAGMQSCVFHASRLETQPLNTKP